MFEDEIANLIRTVDNSRPNDVTGGRTPAPMVPVEHNRSDDKSAPPPKKS